MKTDLVAIMKEIPGVVAGLESSPGVLVTLVALMALWVIWKKP